MTGIDATIILVPEKLGKIEVPPRLRSFLRSRSLLLIFSVTSRNRCVPLLFLALTIVSFFSGKRQAHSLHAPESLLEYHIRRRLTRRVPRPIPPPTPLPQRRQHCAAQSKLRTVVTNPFRPRVCRRSHSCCLTSGTLPSSQQGTP